MIKKIQKILLSLVIFLSIFPNSTQSVNAVDNKAVIVRNGVEIKEFFERQNLRSVKI